MEELKLAIDSERRRMIFDQVRSKAMSRGTPIDDNPEFLTWVELWIIGEYDMSELRSRYNDLAIRRNQRSKSAAGALEPVASEATTPDTD
jgi:hypothetical protein